MQRKISIIVATKDRTNILIESTLKNIQVANYYHCEYIIVNDGDNFHIPNSLSTIKIFDNKKMGVSKARNTGAENATGEILFFIDDDMWITPQTIERISDLSNDNFLQSNIVLMNWEYPKELQIDMIRKKIGRYILQSNYHTLEGRLHKKIDYTKSLQPINGIGSGSFVINKKLFETIGGYNENISFQGEDIDMTNRIINNKINMYLLTEVTCLHNQEDRLDINNFLQRIKHGYESQVKAGITDLKKSKLKFYRFLLPFAPILKVFYTLIPNSSFFDLFTFRLIGTLSSLTYTKAIRNAKA
jgi:glycosyltransferase involved in cell wall biosynthesis